MSQRFQILKVQDLHPDPDQPRHDFDGTPAKEVQDALESLSKNIEQYGVLEPLLVRNDPGTSGFTIIAGERRWRASRLAGLVEVPCMVQIGDEEHEETRLIKQLSENIQREGLSPLDIAKSLKKALETFKTTQRTLAKSLGKHESWVSRHLQMLVAEGPAREALESGLIDGYTTFNVLMSLPEVKQQQIVDEAKARGDAKIPKSVLNKAAGELAKPSSAAGRVLPEPDKQGAKFPPPTVDWEAPGQSLDNSFADFAKNVTSFEAGAKAGAKVAPSLTPDKHEVHLETRLQLGQARRLLELMGAEVPRDEFFVIPALIDAMRALRSD